MFPIKPVSSTLIVNVSSAICWNLPNDMSSVCTLLPCVWPDSRFDLPIISEPSSHGCNSLRMLESMFDDVKRMDKRQFLYQVMHHQEFVTHQLSIDEKIITVIQQVKLQVLSFGMIVSSALMIWKGLMVVTGSESPIVVVLSGSMEPAFQVSINQVYSGLLHHLYTMVFRFWTDFLQRGDLLFLTNYEEEDIRVGEIVVFKIDGRDIPIVHRSDPIKKSHFSIFCAEC